MSAKPNYPGQLRRGGSSLSVTAVAVLLIGVVGGALLLHAAGVVKLPFLTADAGPKAPDRTGQVRFWASGRNIPAYTKISRDDLWNPKRGGFAEVWLAKEAVTPDMLTDVKDIIDFVLKSDKPEGYIFTRDNFFPKGTRAGPTAGVPPGMRALRLRAAQLPGLHGLKQGDRFDVVMSVKVEIEEPGEKNTNRKEGSPLLVDGPYAGLAPGNMTPTTPNAPAPAARVQRQRADVRLIVRNGVIVTPVHERKEITKGGGLLRGATLQAVPIEEIVIAIAPEEVALLNEAITIGATLSVAMRSGQTGAPECDEGCIPDRIVEVETPPPGEEVAVGPRVRLVEVISGGKKKIIAIPEGVEAVKPDETAPAEGSGDAK
jgi:hypothetical protein